MTDTMVRDLMKGKSFWRITPPKEKLVEKLIGLEEELARHSGGKLNEEQKQIVKTCENYIHMARDLITAKGLTHPHLAWALLHRADEHVILLMQKDELVSRAINVKMSFDLTIKEELVRSTWVGDKGKLQEAVTNIEAGKDLEKSRFLLKDALQYLNNFVDYGFWKLSMNNLMSVSSAVLLAVFSLIYFFHYHGHSADFLKNSELMPFALLGLVGGYLSNLLTKEDFLFVWGGPFYRYLLYNLVARPITGAFSAVFFFLVEQSKMIFSISTTAQTAASSVVNINVTTTHLEYVYIVLAIAVGFAGEKTLRGMMDKVLKRLEAKAEKTKETNADAKKSEKEG